MNTCKVLGMVPALSFQSLSLLVHQYLLLEGLLCAMSVLESSIEK